MVLTDRLKRIDLSIAGLLLVMVYAVIVRWRFFTGLALADDFSYGVYSFSLFRNGLPWDMSPDFRALRFSLLFPVALMFGFLPPTEFVAVLYPMILSFGTIVLVHLIGRKVGGPLAGVCAAFVLALFPAEARYGTMLMPDTVVPFFLALAVYAFLVGEDAETAGRARFWYVLSGLAVFLAFTSRENSYYFALFYLPFVFKRERWKRGFWGVAAGFAVPVLLLYTFYLIKTGDFLYQLHLAEQYRDPLIESGYIPSNRILWVANFYFMFPGLFWKITGNPGFVDGNFGVAFTLGVPLLIAASVLAWRRGDRRLLVIPWWFLAGYLFLEYGTISFNHYQMMKKLPRFLLIITPALAVGSGYVLARIIGWTAVRLKRKKRGPVVYAVPVILVALAAGMLYVQIAVLAMGRANDVVEMAKFRRANEILGNRVRRPVFETGGWWRNKLSFYLLPDGRFIDLSWKRSAMFTDLMAVEDPGDLAGSYVIIDRGHFTGENSLGITHSYDSFGGYVLAPPEEWNCLGSDYNVEIYEVPEGWRYDPPGGRDLALAAFAHAMEVRDLMLAIYVMDPDYVAGLSVESFRSLVETALDTGSDAYRRLMDTVTFREYGARWKLIFHPDTPEQKGNGTQ